MKYLVKLCFFLLIPFLAVSQNDILELEKLRYLKEVEWPKAYRDQDTVLLDRILAEEFQMIDAAGGWYTKKDEIAYIKVNKPSYTSFHYDIKRLEIFENKTAVISGIGHMNNKDEKGDYNMTYHSSNVLIKRGDLWKAISSHVSGIKKDYQ